MNNLTTTDEGESLQDISLSIVLSLPSHSNSSSLQVGVASCEPHIRQSLNDVIQYSLSYVTFLEDSQWTHLDALLTRLNPTRVILASTEAAQATSKNPTARQIQRAAYISNTLHKLQSKLQGRNDMTLTSQIIPTLDKEIRNKATLSPSLDSTLVPLLGVDSDRYQSFRNDVALTQTPLAQQALLLLLSHSSECFPQQDIYQLQRMTLNSCLRMDHTAMEAIHLLPTRHLGKRTMEVGGTGSTNSILGVLDSTLTKMGPRLLESWLRQPSVNLTDITQRQDTVHYWVEEDSMGRNRLREEGLMGFRGVDLHKLGHALTPHGSTSNNTTGGGTTKALETLYKLFTVADKHVPCLTQVLEEIRIDHVTAVGQDNRSPAWKEGGALHNAHQGLQQVQSDLGPAASLVETVLDMDHAPREFMVQPSLSEELIELRQELDQIQVELETIHADMDVAWVEVSGSSPGQVKLEVVESQTGANTTGGGAGGNMTQNCSWHFRLLDTNAAKLLQTELSHQVTVHKLLKNGIYFSTLALRQLGSQKQDLMMDYQAKQRTLVQQAMSVAATYVPVLERASDLLAQVDVLASLAQVAALAPGGYCRPELTDGEDKGMGIELEGARHPCVELQESVDFIPNQVNLVFGSSSFRIVTGPNMGGKSTYIRSVGAIVAMAQIGSYVPCTSAKINIVHHLLARVGAGDVQDRGISTFMAEMLEASSILRTATKRSLIIIDELGRGTSTYDGYGLASAISQYIIQRIGCMTIFATHFHELTSLEDSEPSVTNCHVTAHRATDGTNGLTFLYEVHPGPCLESFGIQVAEMANVPAVVVNDARIKAKELENFDNKKRKRQENIVQDMGDGTSMEEVRKKLDILRKFKQLPFKSFASVEEKRFAVKKLLQEI